MKTKQKINRQEKILSVLADLTYATREQLQVINKLGGNRNARRILFEMEKDNLINSVRYDKKIYYLSNKGSDRVGKNNSRLKKSWITHTLMRNDLYIKLGMPNDWKKEVPIKSNDEVLLIPDAMYKVNGEFFFIEIDNTQTMRTNYDKIKKYKELSRMIYQQHRHHLTLVWYSVSEIRKEKLRLSCEENGVKYKIY